MKPSPFRNNTYIVCDKDSGKAVLELFNKDLADKVNRDKYTVQTAYEYLVRLNAQIKASN